jgi:hypothetical protein
MKNPQELPDKITDEPGMEERFQRGLQRALNTPAAVPGETDTKA